MLASRSNEALGKAGGLREAGKAEKRRRLKDATRILLLTYGYEDVTTRQISQRAGVSIGTLFVYAKDKRDLLYLVINDELEPVAASAHAGVPSLGDPIRRMAALLKPWYEYFGANRAIGRCAFRELAYYQHHREDVGEQAVRLRARMQAQEAGIRRIVQEARSRGDLAIEGAPALVASALYDIYLAEIRVWVFSDSPDVAKAMARLCRKFALVLHR